MKKRMTVIFIGVFCLAAICIIAFLLFYNGIILLNNPSEDKYPIRGVDVSSYQGDIDWHKLSEQNIQFAFIKATEGSGFTDKKFSYNFSEALKTKLKVGAYHFFSYDSLGAAQAENFIKTVPKAKDMLPPVIDVEFYGDKKENLPDKEKTDKELSIMIKMLKEHYELTPIIYATEKSYELYIEDLYSECDIWIRNVFFSPDLSDGRNWTFWQYTDKAELKGYSGDEKFIDMNVFNGSTEDFEKYCC